MNTPSPWSTIESASPRVSIVDHAIPCPTNTLVGFRASLGSQGPPGFVSERKARLRTFVLLAWMAMLIIGGIWWLLEGERQHILFEHDLRLPRKPPALLGLQFLDATHPYIRYVGRWTSTPDRTQKDGSFPGVYFEFAFNGSNTVLLSLHNTDSDVPTSVGKNAPAIAFLPTTNVSHAEPISLLARVDDDEYIILPNASTIVLIQKGSLNMHSRHEVRIIAPMVSGNAETLQDEGLLKEEDGQLLPFEDVPAPMASELQDASVLIRPVASHNHKMLEVVTDLPGSLAGRDKRLYSGKSREILGGVLGWEYLLGDMFAVDRKLIEGSKILEVFSETDFSAH
jgi:hypothetical protein